MTTIASIVQTLEDRNPLPPLCPEETWKPELSKEINDLSEEEITGKAAPSSLTTLATRSGLLLWNDDLYASHAISQNISEPIGSYWHGIMHRREGDFGNSKYWFSKVGDSPIFEELYEQGKKIYPKIKEWKQWDPSLFIDEVEEVTSKGEEDTQRGKQLRQLQALEISLLLQYSLHQ
ncbi:hypothetical protein ACTWP4_06720 [Gracilibacillus sp. D59]|uniref:hypothetical protein n=1 Tax=Gracilibacillus sp. D59 TaxID=3457434 RepID=UPI003FCDC890